MQPSIAKKRLGPSRVVTFRRGAIDAVAFRRDRQGVRKVSDGGGKIWVRERGGEWQRGLKGGRGLIFFTDAGQARSGRPTR